MESLSQCDVRYYPQRMLTRSSVNYSNVRYLKALYQSSWCQGVCEQGLVQYCDDNTPLKTTNLIINMDHDEWILNNENDVLAVVGFGTLTPFRSSVINYCIRE